MPWTLKAKNLKSVVTILIIDVFFLTILADNKINLLLWLENWPLNLVKTGTIITLASIAALTINHLFSPNFKAIIVFWRLRNVLPGCRAFSKLVHCDSRIDINTLQKKLGAFLKVAKKQNTLWYQLFKQHDSKIIVEEAHQKFLLFRDVTSMTIIILSILLITALFDLSNFSSYKNAFLLLACQYFIFMVAAQNAGNRLVQNVLALESAPTKLAKRPTK